MNEQLLCTTKITKTYDINSSVGGRICTYCLLYTLCSRKK